MLRAISNVKAALRKVAASRSLSGFVICLTLLGFSVSATSDTINIFAAFEPKEKDQNLKSVQHQTLSEPSEKLPQGQICDPRIVRGVWTNDPPLQLILL